MKIPFPPGDVKVHPLIMRSSVPWATTMPFLCTDQSPPLGTWYPFINVDTVCANDSPMILFPFTGASCVPATFISLSIFGTIISNAD